MTAPLFTVSIAVHNLPEMTGRCLDSLAKCSVHGVQVIVIDNGSDESTQRMLKARGVGVIRSETNVGFGAAHRASLGFALGTYFVVMNNDITAAPGLFDRMRELFLRHSRIGIVGPRSSACVLGPDGSGRTAKPGEEPDYVEGSCLMIPTWLARREGIFDPAFEFAYCEDADLSLRLRQKGWGIDFTIDSLVHSRGQTSKLVRANGSVPLDAHHKRNHELLRAKWGRYLRAKRFESTTVIRRRAARGDVLMLTPIIRALRERNAHLTVAVETGVPEVLAGCPGVALSRESRQKPDQSFDLDDSYESSPKMHIVDAYAARLGLPAGLDRFPQIAYSDQERAAARAMFGGARVAVIHPGITAWSGRNWGTAKFSELARRLSARDFKIAVVGDHSTPKLAVEDRNLRGVSIGLTAAVMDLASVFVGIDSFPMHIAQAVKMPTVGIFGAIDPKLRLADAPFIRGVTVDGLECLGCHHDLKPPVHESQCKRDRVYCMEDLTVDRVMAEVDQVIRSYEVMLETSKIRDRVIGFCSGIGIDIGCGGDKLKPDALGFDKRQSPEVDLVGDASVRMPFEDGYFDYVFSSHALEDIADTAATLREWTRILKPGGVIVIQVPHPVHYKGCNLDHVHPGWSAADLSELVGAAGCEILNAFEDVGENRYSSVVVAKKNL